MALLELDGLTRRFGGVGSPAYNAMFADIEARVARLAAYR